jgi:putative transposase
VHKELADAPQARWEKGGFLPRMPENLDQLDLLLLTVAKTRRVHQDGIHFRGLRYLDLTLAAYVGEEVLIRYDPQDMAEIRVFYHNTFLCRAICPDLADQTISLKEIIRARTQRRRQLKSGLDERTALVEQYLQVHQPELVTHQEVPSPPSPATPRLKRYFNE